MDSGYIAALSKAGTEIIAPAAVQQTVTSAQVLTNGRSMTWHKWKITAVPMYNIDHLMPNGMPYHAKGHGNGYVLTYGGKNFYFAGDTEGTPEMRALKNIDVAFIPMNLPYTMNPDEAAAAGKRPEPAEVCRRSEGVGYRGAAARLVLERRAGERRYRRSAPVNRRKPAPAGRAEKILVARRRFGNIRRVVVGTALADGPTHWQG